MKLSRSILLTAIFGHAFGFQDKPSIVLGKGRAVEKFPMTSANIANATPSNSKVGAASDSFLTGFFRSECDDFNAPPSLSIITRSIRQLASGSDIRGRFIDHPRVGSNMASVAKAISQSPMPALTPFAAHCFGNAFAIMLKGAYPGDDDVVISLGKDPRPHGIALADAFARGAESVPGVRVVFTGIASTPAMYAFCRASLCDAGVMVTASHLPEDRNGFKFFTVEGGFTKAQIQTMIELAIRHAEKLYDMSTIPATSPKTVFCSEWVNWMPHYELEIKNALMKFVHGDQTKHPLQQTLKGLKIVLNSGNGSGGFFKKVLEDLGADVSASIHTDPDGSFPAGIPNPESETMIKETMEACKSSNADLGILLDTDADRSGMILPRTVQKDATSGDYEPLNKNRLIALMGVIFARQSPGCGIVTDSVTSNGLTKFLEEELGLQQIRYLKGYANVISKAQTLTESGTINAEVAIETSGHCALRENDYLDDGTYTACKVIGFLAQERSQNPTISLLDTIASLEEMEEVSELRMAVLDETMESTQRIFDSVALEIEALCRDSDSWTIDTENLEGIRVSTDDGGFFMLRKSLHDPLLCLQIEAESKETARKAIIEKLLTICHSDESIQNTLDVSTLEKY